MKLFIDPLPGNPSTGSVHEPLKEDELLMELLNEYRERIHQELIDVDEMYAYLSDHELPKNVVKVLIDRLQDAFYSN